MIIAWNGSTGLVGRAALGYLMQRLATAGATTDLQAPVEVRLIGRSADRLQAVADDIRTQHPQVTVTTYPECLSGADTDPASWPGAPLDGVDVLVNTAGPGYVVTPMLARYCAQAGLPFVDTAGDPTMVSEIDKDLAAAGTTVQAPIILGAGIQPGLSGILVRLLVETVGPGGTVEIFSGGAQTTTAAAVEEFVESVHSGTRWAGKQWVDGELEASELTDSYLTEKAATFSQTATAHAHCDLEVDRAARAALSAGDNDGAVKDGAVLNAGTIVRWNNINDAPQTQREMQKYMAGSSTLQKVLDAAEIDNFGRKHYFRMEGSAVTPEGTTWVASLNCSDSFLVTSSVTAQAAATILADPAAIPAGIWMPSDLTIARSWWQGVMEDSAGAYIPDLSILDDSADNAEEGEL